MRSNIHALLYFGLIYACRIRTTTSQLRKRAVLVGERRRSVFSGLFEDGVPLQRFWRADWAHFEVPRTRQLWGVASLQIRPRRNRPKEKEIRDLIWSKFSYGNVPIVHKNNCKWHYFIFANETDFIFRVPWRPSITNYAHFLLEFCSAH